MYTGSGFSDWEIGDITVIIHEGIYHLFHLIIPNHDYIAHAISNDGIGWHRTKNAIFVGDPGAWDDDMLWTMDVTWRGDRFYMFYTGLRRKDKGQVSRIGLAVSDDLINWQKVDTPPFPISPNGPHYESKKNNPRGWLSFRDPYYLKYDSKEFLLVCARAASGAVSRRGCIGLIELEGNNAIHHSPLLTPMVYDDVECPCYFTLNNIHYIIGSIREDIKVRYWFAQTFHGPYQSFHADVLIPQGNYAARIVYENGHILVYNFFYLHGSVNSLRVLPPPKQIDTDAKGRLVLRSYYRWQQMAKPLENAFASITLNPLLENPTGAIHKEADAFSMSSESGYEIFAFEKPSPDFIWEGDISVDGLGKLGIVSDMDITGNGYFISFDVIHGQVQVRAWGFNPDNNKSNFIFNNLQTNVFASSRNKLINFKLIRYGHYIELAIDNVVKLTLIDYTYNGRLLGFYTASARITVNNLYFSVLPSPSDEYGSQESSALTLPEEEQP